MAKDKYLVSGIGPGPGGVGALMQNLVPVAKRYGFRVVVKQNCPSIRKLLAQKQYLQATNVVCQRLLREIRFSLRTRSIRGSKIIFLHPQTAGFKTLFRLTKENELFLYVMDNSFFCIRSYNCHPIEKTECLKCLGCLSNVSSQCSPFPVSIDREKNLGWLNQLRSLAPKITFLCQNNSQSKLLKMHFGANTRCIVIGMNTGELRQWNPEKPFITSSGNKRTKPFILFHGAATEPKGVDYVIRLAIQMPSQKFIIPAPLKALDQRVLPENIECRDVTWLNGLRELTQEAALVINPSMWSAPIEGALIKSLAYNQNVATVKTQHGYEREIPDEVGLLRLPHDVSEAAVLINDIIKRPNSPARLSESRLEWLEQQKKSKKFEHFIAEL